MKQNNLLLLLVGAAIVYLIMQNQSSSDAPGSLTQSPNAGALPAGGSVEGIVQGSLSFINNVFDAFKSSAVAQTQPKTI